MALVVASACGSTPNVTAPQPSGSGAAVSPEPEATPDAEREASSPSSRDPLAVPEAPVEMTPPSPAKEEPPLDAAFGAPLQRGSYVFPDGLHLRFSASHECEYDSTAPCSPFEVEASFKGRDAKVNIMSGKTVRIAGHSVQLTSEQLLIVRK